jgi:hypothetical protein
MHLQKAAEARFAGSVLIEERRSLVTEIKE